MALRVGQQAACVGAISMLRGKRPGFTCCATGSFAGWSDKRRRMRFPLSIISAVSVLLLTGQAGAQTVIGLAAPLSGPSAILGEQMRAGAATAAEIVKDPQFTLQVADDACSAEGGAKAARQFVAAKVGVVIGFLCTESIQAALPILKEAGIPVISVGVRTDSLTDRKAKTGWPIFRLGPRADGERDAAGTLLTSLWRDELFAIVDDGTIYGRELSESFRSAAEKAALKPVFVDTFRPQVDNQIGLVGRLKKAGAAKVFAGGDRDDIAIIGRDAAKLDTGLVIAGGEALRAPPGDVPLAAGTLMIALPEWQVSEPALEAAFASRKIVPEGYVLPAYAAAQIARSIEPGTMDLSGRDFATVLGTIRFDEKGDLAENPYKIFRYDGSVFVPVTVP